MLTKAVLCLLLGIAACGPFPSSDQPLPTATATLPSATISLPVGSYCWYSNGRGRCADAASPDALLKSGYLKPYPTAGGIDARINFHAGSPVHLFRAAMLTAPADVQVVPVQAKMPTTISIPAVTPRAAGVYVFEVTGTWQGSGEVSFFLALDLTAATG